MDLPLTQFDKKFDELVKQTRTGQAHWAGTGPAGKTCRECIYWMFVGYKSTGMLKDAKCKKYTILSYREGHAFSHEAMTCKFFEQKDDPPSIMKPKKTGT